MKRKKPILNADAPRVLTWLTSKLWFVMLGHWVLQGIPRMCPTERYFKLAFSVVLACALVGIFGLSVPAVVASITLAHSVNFFLNAQPNKVLSDFGVSRASLAELHDYVARVRVRVAREPSIAFAAVYGSYTRGELSATSDLDINILRAPGARNGIRACLFVMIERTYGTITGVPVDYLVFDSLPALRAATAGERAAILKTVINQGEASPNAAPGDS